jgi:RNA polymerase sigma-70 factor, ECF subfamily
MTDTEPSAGHEAAALMRQIADGRDAALARLIALYGPGITRFATRFLGNAADGDEVAQDTFVRAWREAARYDPAKAAVSTWLYRIATNLCIDRQRRGRFWRLVGRGAVDAVDTDIADDAAGAERTLSALQDLAAIRRDIAALPDRQRMAILLAVVADLETPAIAAIMGASRGSVEQLLVRARQSLRHERDK